MKLLWFKPFSLCYPPRLFSHTHSLSRGSKNKPPAIHVSAPGLSHRLRSFPQNAFIIFQGSTTVFGNKGGFRDEPWGKWSRLMGRITLSPSSCSQGPELGLPKPHSPLWSGFDSHSMPWDTSHASWLKLHSELWEEDKRGLPQHDFSGQHRLYLRGTGQGHRHFTKAVCHRLCMC